jgi:hypothetical protein
MNKAPSASPAPAIASQRRFMLAWSCGLDALRRFATPDRVHRLRNGDFILIRRIGSVPRTRKLQQQSPQSLFGVSQRQYLCAMVCVGKSHAKGEEQRGQCFVVISQILKKIAELDLYNIGICYCAGGSLPLAFLFGAEAQLSERLAFIDNPKNHLAALTIAGHNSNLAALEKVYAVSRIIGLPNICALSKMVRSVQHTVTRQVLDSQARKGLAISMAWESRPIFLHIERLLQPFDINWISQPSGEKIEQESVICPITRSVRRIHQDALVISILIISPAQLLITLAR